MMNLNNAVANLLEKVVANLRSGNSNLTSEEFDLITDCVNRCCNYERELGTDESIRYLNVSRNYFYDVIKPQLKGTKIAGQKTIYYTKKELEKFKA